MTGDPAEVEQVDLARDLVRLAGDLTCVAAEFVKGHMTGSRADQLAELLEETARQVRLRRPGGRGVTTEDLYPEDPGP